jgi:hypothetical protein
MGWRAISPSYCDAEQNLLCFVWRLYGGGPCHLGFGMLLAFGSMSKSTSSWLCNVGTCAPKKVYIVRKG